MSSKSDDNRKLGMILAGLGVFLLLSNIFNISLLGLFWPLFIVLPGLPFLYTALNDETGKNAGFIFPGIIISGTGLILLYQAITGHWESWAYIWVLYPAFVGLGLRFQGERTHNESEFQTGNSMIKYSLMALAGMAFLFEFLIFGAFSGGLLWPLLLLGGGYYLMRKNSETSDEKPKNVYSAGPSAEINPDLKRKIEQALADDDSVATNGKVHHV